MDIERISEQLVEPIGSAATTVAQPTLEALKEAKENAEGSAEVQLKAILQAIEVSGEENIPICQDTGVPHFYIHVGEKFPAINELGKLKPTITKAVRKATEETPLRPNTVHPVTHENTGDNIGKNVPNLNWKIVDGDELTIKYQPKGGGSDNMAQLTMMTPGRGLKGFKEVVLERIASMAGKPCPPTILGVGMGGGSNIAMNLAKEATLRPVGKRHEEKQIAELEEELKKKANQLGVGPIGIGGETTVLDVKIEYAHRHPGSFPIGIVPQCWCNRRSIVKVNPEGEIEVVE